MWWRMARELRLEGIGRKEKGGKSYVGESETLVEEEEGIRKGRRGQKKAEEEETQRGVKESKRGGGWVGRFLGAERSMDEGGRCER